MLMSEVSGFKLVVHNSFIDAVDANEDYDGQITRTWTAPAEYVGQEPQKELEDAGTLSDDHPLQWLESTPPPSPVTSYRYPVNGKAYFPLVHIDPFQQMAPGKFQANEDVSPAASELHKRTLQCALRDNPGQPLHPARGPAASPLLLPCPAMVMQHADFTAPAMTMPMTESVSPHVTAATTMGLHVMAATSPWAAAMTSPAPSIEPHTHLAASGPWAAGMTSPAPMAAGEPHTHLAASGPWAATMTNPAPMTASKPPGHWDPSAQPVQVMSMPAAIASLVPEMTAPSVLSQLSAKDMLVLTRTSMPAKPKMSTYEPNIPFGSRHRLHHEAITWGDVSDDHREFVKKEFMGLLSVVTEDQLHHGGLVRYAAQFTQGELSNADGVGFILSSKLPSPKNIQKIVSIFANRTGRICVRAHSEVVRCDVSVKRIHVGDWVSVAIDLDRQTAAFTVWPSGGGAPSSAMVDFEAILDAKRRTMKSLPKKASCGYFACVVKHTGVGVRLGS